LIHQKNERYALAVPVSYLKFFERVYVGKPFFKKVFPRKNNVSILFSNEDKGVDLLTAVDEVDLGIGARLRNT